MTAEKPDLSSLFKNFENVNEPKECKLVLKDKSVDVPSYLKGTMVRNGPGMFELGETKYNHWFDGLAFMQRYHFENGKMFYSAKFLESENYLANTSRNRIVHGSFGTVAFSDPCKTIFAKLASTFIADDSKHDNANVAFTPVGDQIYACTETPHMYRVDINTLETKQPVDFSKLVSLHSCTAHQAVDNEGSVYNIGSQFGPNSQYIFTKTVKPGKPQENDWEQTTKIGEINCTDSMNPTYMHSFGMSENYLIMFEAPVRISVKKLAVRNVASYSFRDCIYWDETKSVNVFILNKKTGERHPIKYTSNPFFTFHHANTFEKDGCLVVDYCRMEEAGNFGNLSIDNMKTGSFNTSPKVQPHLTRMVIPLEIPDSARFGENLLVDQKWANGCEATLEKDGSIHLKDSRICKVSMEFPRYHWEKVNMREYKYCFGSSVLGAIDSADLVGIVKANVSNGESLVWRRETKQQICGEPIFVPNPDGVEEDDGVLIVPVMTTTEAQTPFVLILDARNLNEIARYEIPEKRIPLGFHAFYQSKFN